MRLPGDAWLTWDLQPVDGWGTVITQTAEFRPRGLLGRLYWLAVAPFHRFVFPGLLAGVVSDAASRAPTGPGTGPRAAAAERPAAAMDPVPAKRRTP